MTGTRGKPTVPPCRKCFRSLLRVLWLGSRRESSNSCQVDCLCTQIEKGIHILYSSQSQHKSSTFSIKDQLRFKCFLAKYQDASYALIIMHLLIFASLDRNKHLPQPQIASTAASYTTPVETISTISIFSNALQLQLGSHSNDDGV